MDHIKAAKALALCFRARAPILLKGAPGVGKTDLLCEVAAQEGFDVLISHPVVAEPTDAKGLPFPDKKGESARFLPYGDLAQALKATRPTIWFLDDLGQAAPDVQASFMQLLLARRIGEHRLPDCVTFAAATNRKSDRAGVTGLLEPVKSRFATIIELEVTLAAWSLWALDHGVPAEMLAFLRTFPQYLHMFVPSADMTNSPSPRTWAQLAKLYRYGIDPDIELEVASGSVGMEAAGEYVKFLRICREALSPDAVLLDPRNADIPNELGALYGLTTALAHLATPQNYGRLMTYAERLQEAKKGEVAGYMLRDAERLCPDVTKTADYVLALSGPLAELFK